MGDRLIIPNVVDATGSSSFEAVGSSVTGAEHVARNVPCQDNFMIETDTKWIAAVVSDGAGSASRALDGARIVTQAICRSVTSYLRHGAEEQFETSNRGWLKEAVIDGIEKARECCLLEAGEDEQIQAFHATVVGCVLADEFGMFFHVGDGGGSAFRTNDGRIEILGFSEPENGEYANQTFFYTEDCWREHLRFTEILEKPDAVWLMTDGTYELMVPHNEKTLRELAVREINRLVFESDSPDRAATIGMILSSQQAAQKNNDDKTLVILRRK